jgi:hypothetical protein
MRLIFVVLAAAAACSHYRLYSTLDPWPGPWTLRARVAWPGQATVSTIEPAYVRRTAPAAIVLRQHFRFDSAVVDLPREGELVLGITYSQYQRRYFFTFRFTGASTCVDHVPLYVQRDGSLRGRGRMQFAGGPVNVHVAIAPPLPDGTAKWTIESVSGEHVLEFVFLPLSRIERDAAERIAKLSQPEPAQYEPDYRCDPTVKDATVRRP